MKNTTQYWKITPGEGGFLWREQKLNGCIAIGWSEIGSAQGNDEETLFNKCLRKGFSKQDANQLDNFINKIQIGDKFVASTSGKWEKLNVEFELRSSGFRSHLPDKERKCDLIVCWEDDDWGRDNRQKRRYKNNIIELKKHLEKIL